MCVSFAYTQMESSGVCQCSDNNPPPRDSNQPSVMDWERPVFVSSHHCRTHRGPVYLRCDVIMTHDITGLSGNVSDDWLLITPMCKRVGCARVLSWKYVEGWACVLCVHEFFCFFLGGVGAQFSLLDYSGKDFTLVQVVLL